MWCSLLWPILSLTNNNPSSKLSHTMMRWYNYQFFIYELLEESWLHIELIQMGLNHRNIELWRSLLQTIWPIQHKLENTNQLKDVCCCCSCSTTVWWEISRNKEEFILDKRKEQQGYGACALFVFVDVLACYN